MYGCNKNVCSHAHKTTRDSFHTQTPTHANSYTKTHTGNYDSALSSSYRWCFGSGPQISQLGHYKQLKGMHLKTHLTDRHLCYLSLSVSWKWVYFICMQKKNSLYFFFFSRVKTAARGLSALLMAFAKLRKTSFCTHISYLSKSWIPLWLQ